MKLASLRNDRDGELIVVSTDLSRFTTADSVAGTLQNALDNWETASPKLSQISDALNDRTIEGRDFDPHTCASPLPRAYQWADGSAYVNHVELVRKARNAEMPPSFWTDPLMYQGGSDTFLGPTEDIPAESEDWGIDMEGEVAVVTGDVKMGASPQSAGEQIRLVMLVNDVSLRNLIPAELAKGFGFFHSKPSSAFSPVAVTPDELGSAWDGLRLHLQLLVSCNGQPFGKANAGTDMTFDFPTLVAHAAKTRSLAAGTIIGSGTVSNRDENGGPGKAIDDGGLGYSCIAELRMIETILTGAPRTPFLGFGDSVEIRMLSESGESIFGSIEQTVVQYAGPTAVDAQQPT